MTEQEKPPADGAEAPNPDRVDAEASERGAIEQAEGVRGNAVFGEEGKDAAPAVQQRRPPPPPPPNGGYGWVCTVCCGLINAHTWGLNSSYGKPSPT